MTRFPTLDSALNVFGDVKHLTPCISTWDYSLSCFCEYMNNVLAPITPILYFHTLNASNISNTAVSPTETHYKSSLTANQSFILQCQVNVGLITERRSGKP